MIINAGFRGVRSGFEGQAVVGDSSLLTLRWIFVSRYLLLLFSIFIIFFIIVGFLYGGLFV